MRLRGIGTFIYTSRIEIRAPLNFEPSLGSCTPDGDLGGCGFPVYDGVSGLEFAGDVSGQSYQNFDIGSCQPVGDVILASVQPVNPIKTVSFPAGVWIDHATAASVTLAGAGEGICDPTKAAKPRVGALLFPDNGLCCQDTSTGGMTSGELHRAKPGVTHSEAAFSDVAPQIIVEGELYEMVQGTMVGVSPSTTAIVDDCIWRKIDAAS